MVQRVSKGRCNESEPAKYTAFRYSIPRNNEPAPTCTRVYDGTGLLYNSTLTPKLPRTLILDTAQESNYLSHASTKQKMCEWQVIQFLTCLHYKNHCILRCQLMSGSPSWQACVPPSSDQRDLARSHDDRDVVAGMCVVCRGLTPRSSRDSMQA
ncbi:hypothetical protein D6D23_05898 [Aureobasidium pullulans]|uniref:Uncharacterized protein n=1 Tax=Aureobasidium pullulans TaxID=5580 RepID=A0A4S8X3K2_AURPU|nr:hypothetical protein D6D23_05898 [Aureobasidium pullulans]THW32581.1 hypothetical protein D6D22_09541 [Aureobasidium pullulans]